MDPLSPPRSDASSRWVPENHKPYAPVSSKTFAGTPRTLCLAELANSSKLPVLSTVKLLLALAKGFLRGEGERAARLFITHS